MISKNEACNLTFLNHASFMVESGESILLCDPWMEGLAFDNGWALLDESTSNAAVLRRLSESGKRLAIWISHEHSDHFSVSFLRAMRAAKMDATVYFQRTLDGRVAQFLRRLGFTVVESNGVEQHIDRTISVTTWPYSDGDSLSLLKCGDVSILNINDCAVQTVEDAARVKSLYRRHTDKIDVMLTQFGYGHWIGNEQDHALRIDAGREKFERILHQSRIVDPECVVPFASFTYFCHRENFYLNHEQNGPDALRAFHSLSAIQDKIAFLKPMDSIELKRGAILPAMRSKTVEAERHWRDCMRRRQVKSNAAAPVPMDDLIGSFKEYRRKLARNMPFVPQMLESAGLVRPVLVRVPDLGETLRLSYLASDLEKASSADAGKWDISVASSALSYVLRNEYGFNTIRVNGRFRAPQGSSIGGVAMFFSPQEFSKNGWGISKPFSSAARFAGMASRLIARRMARLSPLRTARPAKTLLRWARS